MTTATRPTTTVKFTALSPLTTRLLRARTELQQREGKLKVGRTIATWYGEPDELDRLIDYLIMDEIPGAGATSRDVKRLRELRRYLRAAKHFARVPEQAADFTDYANDAAHVEITTATTPAVDRDQILDLLDQMWQHNSSHPAALALTELAEGAGGPHVDYRHWLAENL